MTGSAPKSLWRLGLLAGMAFAALGCSSDPAPAATLITPVFGGDCATVSCSGQGECVQPESNVAPSCECVVGYAGIHCESCAANFHRDVERNCVPDRHCADQGPNPCGSHGRCADSDGVIACECSTGYQGARCTLCVPGYAVDASGDCLQKVLANGQSATLPASCTADACHGHGQCRDLDGLIQCECYPGYDGGRCEECANDYERPNALDRCIPVRLCNVDVCGGCDAFDGGRGFPTAPNTCVSTRELELDEVTLWSTGGEGALWLCAPSARDGLMTEHVALEAGATRPAELNFTQPIVHVSFDYALWDAPALELLADGEVVRTLQADRYTKQTLVLALDPPTWVLGFRTKDGFTRSFALDNLVYEYESSSCE